MLFFLAYFTLYNRGAYILINMTCLKFMTSNALLWKVSNFMITFLYACFPTVWVDHFIPLLSLKPPILPVLSISSPYDLVILHWQKIGKLTATGLIIYWSLSSFLLTKEVFLLLSKPIPTPMPYALDQGLFLPLLTLWRNSPMTHKHALLKSNF